MFKVSQSKIKTWRRCHMSYQYKYVQKLRKKIKNKNLYVGIMVHECLEAHYTEKNWMKVIEKYNKEYLKMFEEERVELEGCVDLTQALMEGYIEYFKDEKLKVVAVEKEILTELCDGIYLEGKIDLIVTDKNNRTFITEHKTCKNFPDEATRMADIQTVIYNWALEKEGIKSSGVIWDYVRKKIPTVPALLKKGGLSKNSKIDTTYEIYLGSIREHSLDPNDYKEILEDLKSKENNFYKRITLPFNKALVKEVLDDTISAAKQIKTLGPIVKDRNMTKDCSWCDYFNLCQTELRGLDSEFMRKKEFVISKRPEKKDGKKEKSKR